MTLHEMVTRHPDCFYQQAWYYGEPFMGAEPRPWLGWPSDVSPFLPGQVDLAYTAADLAALWLEDPTRALWDRYLWTSDTDAQGQRVYVGSNGKGLEIHRHLHLTDRWGVPV
jgi:hypothetical protein